MIIGTNFKLSSAKFLDDRQLCKDYATLIANTEGIIYPPGFEVFCEYENKYYQYVSDSNGGYIWEERKSGVSDGTSASIKDDTISEEYTWSSAHIDSMRIDLETLITQANDYVDEIDERMLFIEGKFQWFEYFDGSYNSLTDKPTIPTKVSELENDSEFLGIERLELELEGINEKIDTKIDKEEDRTLISVTELERLSTVDNYNDTEIRQLIDELEIQSHTHINSDILNTITEEKINQWDNNTGVDDYNYIQNKPIIRVGDDSDILLNFGQIIDEGMYIITAMVGEYKIHNELVHVKWADDDNVTLTIPNMFIVLNASRTDGVWTIVNELYYGIDRENGKISDTLTIGEDKIILDKEGNGWFGGKVSQEGIPTEDKDLVTKGYVDERFANYATNERVSAIEKENARRDVIIEALANGRRRTIETDGNDVDLIFSTEKDNVWIDKIEGETLVNVCDQEKPIAITKSYTVEGTNHVPLQGEYDGKARPVVHGNTLVNHNVEYDKSIIIGEKLDNTHGTEILNLKGTPGCEIKVDIDGHTAINLSTKKEDVLCKSFDSMSGNEINLVAEENSVSDLVIQGNTMVNLANGNYWFAGGAVDTASKNTVNNGCNITITSPGSCVISKGCSALKDNTTYTLIFDVNSNFGALQYSYYDGNSFGQGTISIIDTNDYSNGYTRVVVTRTTTTNCIDVVIGYHGTMSVDKYLNVKNLMLFEGDLTQTPELIPTEYVEGLQSTFEDKLIPYSIYNGDNLTSITETQYQLPLTVKPNTQYTVTTTANTTKYQYAVYSTDGLTEYLSYDTTVTTQTFTCDTNNVYFKVRMNPSYEGDDYSFVLDEVKDKFLIVEGDWNGRENLLTNEYFGKYRVDMSSTDNDTNEIITTKTVYLNSPLLDGDELLTKDGKLYHYHKMGSVVLDGSEDWSNVLTATNTIQFQLMYNGVLSSYDSLNFSDKFLSSYTNCQNNDNEHFYAERINQSSSLQIIISKSKLSTTDVAGFKQWLSENPTTVVYELAEPWYEPIGAYGKIVLDGSEDWQPYFDVGIRLAIPNAKVCENVLEKPNIVCDKLPVYSLNYLANTSKHGISIGETANITLANNLYTGIDALKQWLKESPVTVIYELAEPQYTDEDMRFNIASTSTIEYQSSVPMANTTFLPYRNELPLLESSTQYRVTFDCDTEGLELMVSLGGTSQTITSKLHNELSFITPSLQTDGKLTIDGYGIAKIDNVLITSGSMEYEYFEGLKSGFEEKRKNKIIEVEKGFIDGDNGGNTTDNWYQNDCVRNIDYIKIDNDKTYKFYSDLNYNFMIHEYDGNKNHLRRRNIGGDNATNINIYTPSSDCKYIRFRSYVDYHENNPNVKIIISDILDSTFEELYNQYEATIRIQNPNAPIFGKGGRL